MKAAGKFLVDTNIAIALLENEPIAARHALEGELFLSSVVLGELYFGAIKSGRVRENLDRLEEFAEANVLLVCDDETAREYGIIKNSLREKGRPIPDNDVWIAATARQHHLVLVTRDAHFDAIENLQRANW